MTSEEQPEGAVPQDNELETEAQDAPPTEPAEAGEKGVDLDAEAEAIANAVATSADPEGVSGGDTEANANQPEQTGEPDPNAEALLSAVGAAIASLSDDAEADAAAQTPTPAETLDSATISNDAMADLAAEIAAQVEQPGEPRTLNPRIDPVASGAPASFTPPGFDALAQHTGGESIQMLRDVDLDVTIELGRTDMLIEEVLRLQDGAVVELDKLAGDPVDVYVNGQHVARGEVLVLNDNFCVRISEITRRIGETEEA